VAGRRKDECAAIEIRGMDGSVAIDRYHRMFGTHI
jgi:hypothetical protein